MKITTIAGCEPTWTAHMIITWFAGSWLVDCMQDKLTDILWCQDTVDAFILEYGAEEPDLITWINEIYNEEMKTGNS
jgi:hypothetical protein